MKKHVEKKILDVEARHAFAPAWFAILFNPFFIARRQLYKSVKRFAASCGTGKKILDVGCGIKPYERLFHGNTYVGIEVKGGGHDDRAKRATLFFDGVNIPFPDDEFDIVISSQVFEHAELLDKLVSEIYRVLKPGGELFVTMPFVWPEHEIPYDFRRFTSYGHRQLMENHGFHDIIIKPTTGIFGTIGQLLSDFLIAGFSRMLEKISSRGLGYKFKFMVTRIFIILLCFPVLLISSILEVVFRKKGLTLDYIVQAHK